MKFGERLSALLREPLLHFLIAGLALFVLLGRGGDTGPEGNEIIVDESRIARLAANWEQTWQRPPTAAELDGLVDNFIREEILYREALRLGLDQDDTVIRRRLRSKMEFLARAEAESAVPEEGELQQWLDDNASRYAEGALTSFEQVYIGMEGDGTPLLDQLTGGASPQGLGEALSVPASMANATRTEIARQFGEQFADALDAIETGEWQGPINSGFGRHLVRITEREAGEAPALADVRQQVENDWRAATADAREEAAYRRLRESYDIRIEGRE